MRVFVTGATGFVGSAVVQDLLKAGHQVLGLSRSEAGAQSLRAAGAEVHRGDLEDLESLRTGAAGSDGVIHTAFIHEFSRYAECCAVDRRAIETIGDALAGSNRPFVVTSGSALLNHGVLGRENDFRSHHPLAGHRGPSEDLALSLAEKQVKVSIVRLAPSVHGDGDHGFVPMLMDLARRKGVSAYIGEGLNRWPAVHRLDAATLFRLALEKGTATSRFHGAAEEGIAFRKIAEVIGKRLNLPVLSKSPEEAAQHFEWFTAFAGMDNPVSSAQTQQFLGWNPQQISLISDLDRDGYGN